MSTLVVQPPITKHPDESCVYQMDFINLLQPGELVTGVVEGQVCGPISYVPDDGLLTIGSPSIVNGATGVQSAVQFRISGGDPEGQTDYLITVNAQTSESNTIPRSGLLRVRLY